MNRLLQLGFKKIGVWKLVNDNLDYYLESNKNHKNVLYSFVSNNIVKYIGKTVKPISQRLYGYKNPSESQRTNFGVNKYLIELLNKGENIDILIFIDNAQLKYHNYKINLAAGLEDILISEIQPDWNYNAKNLEKPNNKIKLVKNKIIESDEYIIVTIGQAYYNDGFFNIRKRYSELFGSDLSKIKIQLGDNNTDIIEGYVNRTANSNGTPRIMAGKNYTEWIQNNFNQGDIFKIEMINSHYIILKK